MKKPYSKPLIEEVNPRLLNVVLDDTGWSVWSNGAADVRERQLLKVFG